VDGEYIVVKELRGDGNVKFKDFKNEADQLNRFNGLTHPHLVTLLATYQLTAKATNQWVSYHLVFPRANCNLDVYWEDHVPTPEINDTSVLWLADQLLGLVGALKTIHEPTHLDVDKFGRHGDIKPDNILCYPSTKHNYCMLVITDLGLSELNSIKSRSNKPGEKVPPVPGYRPPECDIREGLISRLFDVWTLGCLFLDIVAWFMGGWELKEKLRKERETINILSGVKKDIFYDLFKRNDGPWFMQCVKPQVEKVRCSMLPLLRPDDSAFVSPI
jgi:serine/threonine protein kinase